MQDAEFRQWVREREELFAAFRAAYEAMCRAEKLAKEYEFGAWDYEDFYFESIRDAMLATAERAREEMSAKLADYGRLMLLGEVRDG